jgi:transposase-like protein
MSENNGLKPGDTKRFDCADCKCEFEVCNEPKLNEMDNRQLAQKMSREMNIQTVSHCPFCGGDNVTSEEL